ncbi:MAG: Ger(x)C family spore germination C-terminal domain-containing protein [Clostridia bacterium]
MAILKKKWIVLLIMLVTLIAFESLVVQIPLSKRVIAIGIGLDMVGEDIELSAQVIIPNKNKGSQNTQYQVFSAKGKTVQQAIATMQAQIGATPSFAHTLVALVGKDFVGQKLFDTFKTFMASTIISDNALIGYCDKESAKDVLSAKMTVNNTVPYNMQNSMLADEKPIGQVVAKIKDYFKTYYQVGGCSYLPIVAKQDSAVTAGLPLSHKASLIDLNTAALVGEEEGGAAGSNTEKDYIINLDTAVIVDRNFKTLALDKEQTRGLTLVKQRLKDGNFNVVNSFGESIVYYIERSKTKVVLDNLNMCFEINMVVENIANNNIAHDNGGVMSNDEKNQIASEVTTSILSGFNLGKLNDMDIFNVGEMFYAKYGQQWLDKYGENYLDRITPSVNVKIKVK